MGWVPFGIREHLINCLKPTCKAHWLLLVPGVFVCYYPLVLAGFVVERAWEGKGLR